MSKNLTALLKKRERIDAEIAAAEAIQKRKNEVLDLPEFVQILSLSNDILSAEFSRIASQNSQPHQ